jgi:hypothetical protein
VVEFAARSLFILFFGAPVGAMGETADALAANLFLQPSVMRTIVRYLLTSHTPLDELGDGRRRTRLDELESDTHTIADALLKRPAVFDMALQMGVLARDPQAKPRTQCVFYWDSAALAIPDTLLIEAKFHLSLVPLACMAADPALFWTNVVYGGMTGHVVCKGFRFLPALIRAYSPPFAIALLVEAQLEALTGNIDADQMRVHGDFHVRAIGNGLLSAAKKAVHLSPSEAGAVRTLAQLMVTTHDDTGPLRERLRCFVKNMEALALREYNEMRDCLT